MLELIDDGTDMICLSPARVHLPGGREHARARKTSRQAGGRARETHSEQTTRVLTPGTRASQPVSSGPQVLGRALRSLSRPAQPIFHRAGVIRPSSTTSHISLPLQSWFIPPGSVCGQLSCGDRQSSASTSNLSLTCRNWRTDLAWPGRQKKHLSSCPLSRMIAT